MSAPGGWFAVYVYFFPRGPVDGQLKTGGGFSPMAELSSVFCLPSLVLEGEGAGQRVGCP